MRRLTPVWLACCLLAACTGAAPLAPEAVQHNSYGAAALARGDLETAAARFEIAIEYHPEFVEAVSNLGLVEMNRGNFDRARQLFERARRLNPDIAQPHHSLGVLAEREQRPDVASDHYRSALRVDPGFAASRRNLARLLLQAGLIEPALLEYRKLREVEPGDVAGHTGYVEALLRLRRLEEAFEAARLGRDLLGDDPTLRVLEARLELASGRLESAEERLLPVIGSRDGHAVEALAWLAVIELWRGHAEEALRHGKRALDLDPQHPLTNYVVALSLDELGDPDAPAWLARAARLNPDNPELARRQAGATSNAAH